MNTKPAAFPHFFDPERIGHDLKEVSSDLLREEHDLIARWFHATDEIDLFLWTDAKKMIVKQQLTFYGQVVEWNVVEGTKTGAIIEDESPGAGRGAAKPVETIRFDDAPQAQPLGLAMDLIRHATVLSELERKQIVANYFRGQKISGSGPGAFFERYATWKKPAQFRVGFLARIKKFLRWLIKPI